jgi:hypothetical protein
MGKYLRCLENPNAGVTSHYYRKPS